MDLCERHSRLRCGECAYIEQLEEENQELINLNLWALRRIHKIYKEFGYKELEKVTGKEFERD